MFMRSLFQVLLQKLSHVEQWTGTIKILNTDFQNLSFFKSLKTVKASWNNVIIGKHFLSHGTHQSHLENERIASFWIELNPNLTTLGMPNLVNVYADILPTNHLAYSWVTFLFRLRLFSVYWLKLIESYACRKWNSWSWELWNEVISSISRCVKLQSVCSCSECIPNADFFPEKYCFSDYFGPTNIPLGCQILMSGIWIRDETVIVQLFHWPHRFAEYLFTNTFEWSVFHGWRGSRSYCHISNGFHQLIVSRPSHYSEPVLQWRK